jgi:CubicO group peptidase (beta-lactamase class C family)
MPWLDAAASTLDTDGYRRSLQTGVDSGAYDQLAVGWIDGDERATWFLGKASKPTLESRFEIGALSEIFTGLLFAQSAYDGKLRLRSTVHDAMPDVPFGDPRIAATMLNALATHRSGLPPIPPNLFPASVDDPYGNYSDADLLAFLANYRRPPDDGGAAAYSPLDAGLLGFALARNTGGSLAAILNEKILAPLTMTHTGFDDGSLLDGHALGQPAAHWHFGALAGAGGLRSTLGDLLNFLQANLRPPTAGLRAALLLARQPQQDTKPQVGLGWNVTELNADGQTWPLLWRASTTAGFSAFVAFRTDRQQALVLLGNTDADLSRIGLAWMQGDDAVAAPSPAVAMAPIDLAAYAGLYKIRSVGTEIIVRSNGQRLSAQLRGSPDVVMQPIADDVFAARSEAMMLSFQRDLGKVTSVVIDHGGVNLLAERLASQAPHLERKVMSVPPSRLAEFAGDFRLDDFSIARITVDGGGLDMQLTGRPVIPLAAFANDRFTDVDNSCEVTFRHDSDGKVNSASISFAGIDRIATRLTWRAPASHAN